MENGSCLLLLIDKKTRVQKYPNIPAKVMKFFLYPWNNWLARFCANGPLGSIGQANRGDPSDFESCLWNDSFPDDFIRGRLQQLVLNCRCARTVLDPPFSSQRGEPPCSMIFPSIYHAQYRRGYPGLFVKRGEDTPLIRPLKI